MARERGKIFKKAQEMIYFPVPSDEFHPDEYNETTAFQLVQM